MRTRKMRLVSALLALAMMFLLVPVGAFAEEENFDSIYPEDKVSDEIPNLRFNPSGYPYSAKVLAKYGERYRNMDGTVGGEYVVSEGDTWYYSAPHYNLWKQFSLPTIRSITLLNPTQSATIDLHDLSVSGTLYLPDTDSGLLRMTIKNARFTELQTPFLGRRFTLENVTVEGSEIGGIADFNWSGSDPVPENEDNVIIESGLFKGEILFDDTVLDTNANKTNSYNPSRQGTNKINDGLFLEEVGTSNASLTINNGNFLQGVTHENQGRLCINGGVFGQNKDNILTENNADVDVKPCRVVNITDGKFKAEARGEEHSFPETTVYTVGEQPLTIVYTGTKQQSEKFLRWEVRKDGQVIDSSPSQNAKFTIPTADETENTAIDIVPIYEDDETPDETVKYKLTVVGAESVMDDEGNNLIENNEIAAKTFVSIKAPETDPSGMVFSRWVIDEPDGIELNGGFDRAKSETQLLMPKSNLTLHAEYIIPDQTGSDDDFMSTTVAVVGGAALASVAAWQGYNIFAEAYMKGIWPILPENRGELALSLWHDANEPAAVNTTLYTDLEEDDADAQTAARWAVENELMKPADKDDPDMFRPYRPVTPGQVYRA